MKTIQVQLDQRSYSIQVEPGLINNIPEILSNHNHGQKWIIISQYRLMEFFGFDLQLNLKNAGFDCDFITVPVGSNKSPGSIVLLQLVNVNTAIIITRFFIYFSC